MPSFCWCWFAELAEGNVQNIEKKSFSSTAIPVRLFLDTSDTPSRIFETTLSHIAMCVGKIPGANVPRPVHVEIPSVLGIRAPARATKTTTNSTTSKGNLCTRSAPPVKHMESDLFKKKHKDIKSTSWERGIAKVVHPPFYIARWKKLPHFVFFTSPNEDLKSRGAENTTFSLAQCISPHHLVLLSCLYFCLILL